jgi:drug/metabolite transporter (DMT)-like permease
VSSWNLSLNVVFPGWKHALVLQKGEHHERLFWIGVVFVVLGIASLVVPIPHNERSGVKVGGASIGIETRHEEKVSPIIGAVLIAAGAAMMIAGRKAVSN